MIEGAVLDHVALAVERWSDAWPPYVTGLGGRWRSGGQGPGFAPAQLAFANDMRLEVIAPYAVDTNDFLRRFLDRHGPGPHHLTYKVPDLAAALGDIEAAGLRPVNVDLSDPGWKEAFLHPSDATGVVVQLAQAAGGGWFTPAPEGFPTEAPEPAALTYVGHAVASMDQGLPVFRDLLGGTEVDHGDRWVELAWPGPGRLRLLAVEPDELDGRRGRVDHIAFTCPDPGRLAGARPRGDGCFEIAPERAAGVRLVVSGLSGEGSGR